MIAANAAPTWVGRIAAAGVDPSHYPSLVQAYRCEIKLMSSPGVLERVRLYSVAHFGVGLDKD